MTPTRRQLLASAGATALIASLGSELFTELGFAAPRCAGDDDLDLGDLASLAGLFEEVDPRDLLPKLVAVLREGTSLDRLVAAGALANARSLGGEDYEGYHAFMGMAPALAIARELPPAEQPLPVLKTLKRSAVRMHRVGGGTLRAVEPQPGDPRAAVRARDVARAERALAASAAGGTEAAWRALHPVIVDDIEVHLVVFAWRTREIAELAGPAHALTSMRQILHFASDLEEGRKRQGRPTPAVRQVVPALMETHGLVSGELGSRDPGAAAIDELADVLVTSSREAGAAACAAALGQGVDPRAVAEALSLASTRLQLRDPGREKAAVGKPVGSVHGASVGVHASDSALAWREIAMSVGGAARAATLLTGAFHTAGQGQWVGKQPYPFGEQRDSVAQLEAGRLAGALGEAASGGDQPRAGAIAERMSRLGRDEEAFSTLRPIAVAQDGALHAEKYQLTARVVHGYARDAFRAEHLVAFARTVASQACAQAPEVAEARALLG